jgi:hypothetical protein
MNLSTVVSRYSGMASPRECACEYQLPCAANYTGVFSCQLGVIYFAIITLLGIPKPCQLTGYVSYLLYFI